MSLIIRNLNCTCRYWFTYACGDRPWCRLRFLMMSDITLETCWTINVRWNNKFPYQAASRWLFLLVILRCTVPWMLNVYFSLCNLIYYPVLLRVLGQSYHRQACVSSLLLELMLHTVVKMYWHLMFIHLEMPLILAVSASLTVHPTSDFFYLDTTCCF